MKKIIALVMTVCLINLTAIPAFASIGYDAEATELKSMGLFQGTNKGFELELAPTRAQAAVMLVRFLGKEDEALAQTNNHPFKDVPKWADKYIGYLYANNLTKGINNSTFGSNNPIDSKSYVTYLLRSLGYDDANGDFTWQEALNKGIEVGIMTKEEGDAALTGQFLRGNMVHQSYSTLSVSLKGKVETLKEILIAENVIGPMDDSYVEDTDYVTAKGGPEDFYVQNFGIGFIGQLTGKPMTQAYRKKHLYEIYFSKGYNLESTPTQQAWMYIDMGFAKPLKPGKFSITFYAPNGSVVKTVDFQSSADNNYFTYNFNINLLKEIIDTDKYGYVYFKKTVYSVDGEELEIGGKFAIADTDNPVLTDENYYPQEL